MKQFLTVLPVASGIAFVSDMGGCSALDKDQPMLSKTIEQVQEEHTGEWMAIPGVEGTGIGLFKGKPCIKVFTSVKTEKLRGKIPSSVEGYPVIIEETGVFRALEQQ